MANLVWAKTHIPGYVMHNSIGIVSSTAIHIRMHNHFLLFLSLASDSPTVVSGLLSATFSLLAQTSCYVITADSPRFHKRSS